MTTPATGLDLRALLEQAGARFAEGEPAAFDYGDWEAEYAAIRGAAGLTARADRALLLLRGEDRARFLHGLVTCDVQGLADGEGAYGFFTSPQGRILADAFALASADELTVSVPASAAAELAEHLRRYLVMDRVEVETVDLLAMTLVGPEAVGRLHEVGLEVPADAVAWRHGRAELAGAPLRWLVDGRLGEPGVTIWTEAEHAAAVWERLAGLFGVRPVGRTALDTVRVEEGIPRFGADFGPDNLPQETGEQGAISYTKGCYLGQEVVARIHYRGKVNRRLRGLRVDGDALPPAGRAVLADGRVMGTLGSSVYSRRLAGPIGLAILHDRGGEPQARVDIDGEWQATVVDLPFAD